MYRALTVATRVAFAVLIPVAAAQTRGVFVTPISNVPLLAVVNTQNSQILKDGTTLNRKTLSAIARDPRTGDQTTTVTQLDRGEPDPAIFEIPSGYKIIQRGVQ